MITKQQALEALDNLDDYARMDVGVDAIGSRRVLREYIEQSAKEIEKMREHLSKLEDDWK